MIISNSSLPFTILFKWPLRCCVCIDTFSTHMMRPDNDANMLPIGVRVVGEGLALDIVDAIPTGRRGNRPRPAPALSRIPACRSGNRGGAGR